MKDMNKAVFAIAAMALLGAVVGADSNRLYVKNDGSMIPDKYNTGPNPKAGLEKINASEQGAWFNVGDLKFYRGTPSYYGAYSILFDFFNFKDGPPVITVENQDFSDFWIEYLDNHHFSEKRKVIFKNCSFRSFGGARVHNENTTIEFYDCDFDAAHGSYMSFERCMFHITRGDAMNLYSDVVVKNSYFYIIGDVKSEGAHIDGYQIFGKAGFDAGNITFSNVRIELPKIKIRNGTEWYIPYVNAPIMVALEYSDAHYITAENMHINGGGYSIYWGCTKQCRRLTHSVARNISVGYGHMFGILYKNNRSAFENPDSAYENVDHLNSLYICSFWKSDTGVHMSVTNELLTNRTMICIADGTSNTTHTIPAHPHLTQKMPLEDVPVFSDLPYDIDVIVAPEFADEIICYDVTETGDITTSPLVKRVKFSELNGSSMLRQDFVVLCLFALLHFLLCY